MRVLVTGSMGFVGTQMMKTLTTRGHDVTGCDVKDGWDVLDLFRYDDTHFDLVVHAAAALPHRAAIDEQPATHIYNAHLDAAMFDWAERTGQGHVLYLSSCAALDEHPDAYGHLKLNGERLAEHYRRAGGRVTVVRPFSGYGETQGEDWPFGAFVGRARRREDPFVLWNADAVRDWIHIEDVVNGALACVAYGTDVPVSLCTGRATSCGEVAKMVTRAAGYSPTFVPGKGPRGADRRVGDPRLLIEVIGYVPKISLEEGVCRATLTCGA